MSRRPWMKFYPADWRADAALRICDPMSRYVWLEMIGIMHEATPYGHLVINGKAVSDEALSTIIGVPLKAVRIALKELGRNAVYSVTNDGIIFSRRMVRDEMKATSSKVNGALGGNPVLKNQEVSATEVNPDDNAEVKAQIPDARHQTKKTETNVSAKKGTRLPDDWRLDDLSRQHAVKLGLSPHQVETEADKFRDYWRSTPGQKGVKLDWPATWRNWIRNAVERQQRSQAPPKKTAHREHQDACHASVLRELYGDDFDEFTGTTIEH